MPDDIDAYHAAVAMVLKLRRAELDMTIKAVADATGLKYQAVQSYLSGERPMVLGNFLVIARALQIDPSQVMEDAEARMLKSQATST